jgi:hypothetical protein
MTVLASAIISRVRAQLQDTNAAQYRWSDAELLGWISDAQRAIVAMVADAANSVQPLPLVAGPRQALPSGVYTLLGVTRNLVAVADTTPQQYTSGPAVRLVKREVIDAQNPNWPSYSPNATVKNYLFDPQDKQAFYVVPPNDGTGIIEVNLSQMPADVTDDSQALTVQDIYQTPVTYYTLAWAHLKENDYAGGVQVSAAYTQAFEKFLMSQGRDFGEEQVNNTLSGFNPQVKGAAK